MLTLGVNRRETKRIIDRNKSKMVEKKPNILWSLPTELLDHVFSFLTFEDIALARPVCRWFNAEGRRRLNEEAARLLVEWDKVLYHLKYELLPRRPSLREKHPMWERYECMVNFKELYVDLGDTYAKHFNDSRCCFHSGKLLDDTARLLKLGDDLDSEGSLKKAAEIVKDFFMSCDNAKDFYELFVLDIDFYGPDEYLDPDFDPVIDLDYHTRRRLNEDGRVLRSCGIEVDPMEQLMWLNRGPKLPKEPQRRKLKRVSVAQKLKILRRRMRTLLKSKERIVRMNRGLKLRNEKLRKRVWKKKKNPNEDPEWKDYNSQIESTSEEDSEEEYMKCFDDAGNIYKYWDSDDSDYGVGFFYSDIAYF